MFYFSEGSTAGIRVPVTGPGIKLVLIADPGTRLFHVSQCTNIDQLICPLNVCPVCSVHTIVHLSVSGEPFSFSIMYYYGNPGEINMFKLKPPLVL